MKAVEFSGKIEQGMIQLPDKLEEYNNTQARIILLIDQDKPVDSSVRKEKLRDIFQKMEKTSMFSKIQDPTQWQKRTRDEWQ